MTNKLLFFSFLFFVFGCTNKVKINSKSPETKIPEEYEIIFQVKTDNKDYLDTFEDGIIPWISVKDPQIEDLIGKEEIVLKCDSAIMIIDYPLNSSVEVVIKPSKPDGFTRKELAEVVSREYHRIYSEEEESAHIKTIPIEEREGIVNRNQTDGKYGIWGHDIGDLDLSSIIIYREKKGLIKLELIIES